MRSFYLAASLALALPAFAAQVVEDRDVGTVRAFARKVRVDLEACKREFKVYTLPMVVSAQGTCRVEVVSADRVPATVQTTTHAEQRELDGEAESRRLTFHGDGRAYALAYYDRAGIPNWEAAEKRFRKFLEEKVNGGVYETVVTKVVFGK
jgi:hypothetical protein